MSAAVSQEKFFYGGQAVLEGVMMRGVSTWAVAVRKPSEEQLTEGERSPEQAALGEIAVTTFTAGPEYTW